MDRAAAGHGVVLLGPASPVGLCVHPHITSFADTEAQKLVAASNGPISLDLQFFDRGVDRTAATVKASLARTAKWTHIGIGQAKVEKVASNWCIVDGKAKYSRTSATKDARIRDEPEGLIDPWLKTLGFWDGDKPLAALHYYATHPMSYSGDGQVTRDFCGLARDKRAGEDGKVFQTYFTGCAGNVTAGKYNDGAKMNGEVLRDRVVTAMRAAWKAAASRRWRWRPPARRRCWRR